jgi:hypothetical protein
VDLWRDSLIKQGKSKAAQELVSPIENPEAFPDLKFGLAAQYFRDATREHGLKPASSYPIMDEQENMVAALKARNFPPEKAMEACQAIIASLAPTNGSSQAPPTKKEQQPVKNSIPIKTESANNRPVSPTKKPINPPNSSTISPVSSAYSHNPQPAAEIHKEKTPIQTPTDFRSPTKHDKSADASPMNMNVPPKMAVPVMNKIEHSPFGNTLAPPANPASAKIESPVTPTFDDFEGFGSADTPDIDDDEIDELLA